MAKLYLKEWREHAGLTLERAGDLIGVTHATVQRWESAKQGLPSARLTKIAEAYGLSNPQYLFSRPTSPGLSGAVNTGKHARHPDGAAGNEQVITEDHPGGAQEGETMTPETEVITEVYEHLDPQRRRELRQHAWKLLNEQVGAAEGAKPRPTRVRRS